MGKVGKFFPTFDKVLYIITSIGHFPFFGAGFAHFAHQLFPSFPLLFFEFFIKIPFPFSLVEIK